MYLVRTKRRKMIAAWKRNVLRSRPLQRQRR